MSKHSLRRFFFMLFLVPAILHEALAQPSLCISKGPTATSLDFNPDAFGRYLQPERYKVVLVGEMHNGSFNPELEYHLITTLNKQCGIRYVFKEMSVSSAWHYNQYLRTGDTSYISNGRMVANYGLWPQFWRRLYAYNRTLPDSLKLMICGVDFEDVEVFQTIMQLAPAAQEVPVSLQPMLDTVKAHLSDEPPFIFKIVDGKMIESDNSGFTNPFRYVQAQLTAFPEDAKRYFGSNYPVLQAIAANTGKMTAKPKPRNKTMFQAMRRTVAEQKIGKFMGVFGSMHTSYAIPSSIANAVNGLPGIGRDEVLNLAAVVYNLKRRDGALVRVENQDQIIGLNTDCKASVVPAKKVSGYRRRADFVIIGDAAK